MKRRLPAEWEPQSGIMLTWPHENTGWSKMLPTVEPTFAEIAARASEFEKVLIVAKDATHQTHIVDSIKKHNPVASSLKFAFAGSNDSWARDHGPISIIDDEGDLLLLDFEFNGWGNKYPSELDNEITQSLVSQHCFSPPTWSTDFILEGGSIESDGEGTLLTTSCLLTTSRNEGWTKEQIENELTEQFNLKQVHWLHQGHLQGDDTDAHIDTLARFITPHKIMYARCDDRNDPHYQPLLDMEQELASLRTLDGKPYQLIPLPLPEAVFNEDGDRLPATYANFLIINDAVLLPIYNQAADEQVMEIFRNHFSDRKIIPINCLPLIEQFGSLHCVTMQFPEGVLVG